MKKDKEWLKNEISRMSYVPAGLDESNSIISTNWVLSFVEQLEEPEQERVTVPQFVAKWIETMKQQNFTLGEVAEHLYLGDIKWSFLREHERWAKSNFTKFARAWLDGYTVEKEKLYRVELIKGKYLIYNRKNNQLHNQELDVYVGDHEQREFIEQEIKAIDERYWAFKVEVEAE